MSTEPDANKEQESTSAEAEGSGAIAQDGSVAAGERGVAIGGDVKDSTIITGDTIIYKGVKPVSARDLLDACRTQVNGVLHDARHKYDPKLYVHRAIERELNTFFDTPLDGPAPNCFLIVAPAGSGKTNLLCELARERVERQPALLLMGGNTYLSGTTGLLGAVKEELETASSQIAFRSAGDSLHTLHRLAEEMNHDALLILDAINEADRPVAMRQALEDLLRKTRNRRIKLAVTCRDYYWGLFKGPFWEGATVNGLPAEDDVDEDDAGAGEPDFSRFAADEHEQALMLYLEHYAISGRPVGDAAEQCRHPLLLRFFCEAYRGQDVGQIEDIRLKELFDRYWVQKLVSIADRMIKQGDERLQNGLAEEVGGYLLNIAAYMLHDNVRAVPLNEMSRATKRTERYDDPRSVYGRIRDEFIILEEKARGGDRHKVLQVAFVYEEFMEYVMARSLMRDWYAAGLDEAAILSELEALIEKYGEFAQILGVMVYLALMLKEERDLALWPLLLSRGEEWRKVIFGAFRQLPEGQIDEGILGVLEEMLTTGEQDVQIQVLDTLKIQRIGSKAQASLLDAVSELVACDQEKIARRAVLALGNTQDTDRVLPALVGAVRYSSGSVRENTFKTLVRIGVLAVEPLIAALRDDDADVRRRAVEALAQIGRLAVEPLIAALRDDDVDVRWRAIQTLGKIGDPRAVEPLIASLQDWGGETRGSAVEALGRIGDARAVEPLVAILWEFDRYLRLSAVEALGKIGDSRAVEPLIAVLRDRDSDVRAETVKALERIGGSAVEPLIAALKDDDGGLRRLVAWALGQIGDPRAVEPLVAALGDRAKDWQGRYYVQEAATDALKQIGTPQAVAALEEWKQKREGDQDA